MISAVVPGMPFLPNNCDSSVIFYKKLIIYISVITDTI
jgi:hypothetical protein